MSDIDSPAVDLLRRLVDAYDKPHPSTHGREPIFFFRSLGGPDHLQHHALGADADKAAHESDLEDLASAGLLDIDYGNPRKLVPTPRGRKVVQDYVAANDAQLRAPADDFLEAAAALAERPNPLAWVHVRTLLHGLRDHWQHAGFPAEGIRTRPLIQAVVEEHRVPPRRQ